MRISTRTHALLDIATVGFALGFPRMLGASNRFTKAMTAVAVAKMCPFDQPHLTAYSLTRHDAAHGSEDESDRGALAGTGAGPAGHRAVGTRVVPGEQLFGARVLLVAGKPGPLAHIGLQATASPEAGDVGLHSRGR